MSIESVAIALHHSRAKGAAKLVLIGIANHDGDGGSWPSMATLAKYAGVTPDQARRLVRKLQELREVRVLVQQGGLAETPDHLRPNRYEVLITCPPSCDGTTRHRDRNVLFRPDATPVDNLWIDPPASPLSPIRGTVARMAEPSSRTTRHREDTHVPERARATSAHTDPRTGRSCTAALIDARHCELGCLITEGSK